MGQSLSFVFPRSDRATNPRVASLLSACAHYGRSDRPLFVAGYEELCRADLDGGRVLEVCCGAGELARAVAQAFPKAEVIGLDRYAESGAAIREAREREGLDNARYLRADALRLTEFPDASLDLVYGQATLHHLAHDIDALRHEFARVLKPGGRLVFIYEPLGHNPIWAMIRAYRIARAQMPDESNVTLGQLEEINQSFCSGEVQLFNFLGYPFKALGRIAGPGAANLVYRADAALMRRWPWCARMAANFNACFTR